MSEPENTLKESADYVDALAAISASVETELRRLRLWEDGSPPDAALESENPFCFDTLMFHQWIQWVFLPKIAAIVRNDEPLPEVSQIYPYAEQCLDQHNTDTEQLLFLVRSFDELIEMTRKTE